MSGTVPMPVALGLDGVDWLELEEVDDEVELLLEELINCCERSAICLLTRVMAAWLAMLDNPVSLVVSAEPMAEISELSAVEAWFWACRLLQ